MTTAAILRQLVFDSLSNHLFENAKFYCERLFYENFSDDSVYLLAECYLRQGKTKQAYMILQNSIESSSHSNKYLFATTCVTLGNLEEAENILLSNVTSTTKATAVKDLSIENLIDVPGKAAGVYLLGKISRQQHREDLATNYFKICLQVIFFFLLFRINILFAV